jgi:hypothetical protein
MSGALCLLLAACGGDDGEGTPGPAPDTGGPDGGDGTPDVDAPDADGDAGGDPDTDTGVTPDVGPDGGGTVTCTVNEDCTGPEEACVFGFCRDAECFAADEWAECVDYFDALGEDLGRFATCLNFRCERMCVLDSECAEGEICADFGLCAPFDPSFMDLPPAGDGTLRPLQAGFSEVYWNYPIGVPAGGYGERAAGQDGQYALGLRATAGQTHALDIRTSVLDDGVNPLIIVRIPVIFTGMELHEEVALYLDERTGRNWRDNLIVSSTHTHSGPCRHWHLPTEAALLLGSFGIGEFHQQFYDWIAESVIEGVGAALDDMAPARLGWTIIEGYDTHDRIGRDRWSQTPQFDDNRLLLMRVDGEDGTPRGVFISFGAHATVNGSDYLSGDVLDGAERQLNYRLGEEFDRYIPVFFLNQNSGSMSPAADFQGHRFPQDVEPFGLRFMESAWEPLMEMETSANVRMRSNTYRFPISYDLMGYERGELSGQGERPIGGEYHYGGLSCVGPFGGDQNYNTVQDPRTMQCVGALHFLLFNRPPTTFMKSQVTVGQIQVEENTPLSFTTVPGELAMELSWELLRDLRDDFGVDPLSAWTFGYANDHLLYTLPTNLRGERPPFPGLDLPHPENTGRDAETNLPLRPGAPDDYPDFAFSLLQGGYESTMSPWGYRTGDYLRARIVDAWARMEDPTHAYILPEIMPNRMTPIDMGRFTVETTPASAIRITSDALVFGTETPGPIRRYDTVELAWIGGYEGAEQPQTPIVTLEREVDGTFQPLVLPNTRPYDNREPLFMTRMRRSEGQNEWIVRWEELHDFPLGRYRFRINGHHFDGTARLPYELFSRTFALQPMDDLSVTVTSRGDRQATGILHYPVAERMEFLERSRDRGYVEGHFRTRHPLVPTGDVAPIEDLEFLLDGGATFTVRAGGSTVDPELWDLTIQAVEERQGRRVIPRTQFVLTLEPGAPAGPWDISVQLEDPYGNSGTASFTLE